MDIGKSENVRDSIVTVYHYLTPALSILVLVLNALVVVSVILVLRRHFVTAKTVYVFLGNVALADFINAVLVLAGLYYKKGDRDFCFFSLGSIIACTLSSLLSVALIAVDRFLYILHGMHYRRWLTMRRAYISILVSISLSLAVAFMPQIYWNRDYTDRSSCVLVLIASKTSLLVVAAFGVVPILAVVVLYGIILYKATRTVNAMRKLSIRYDEDVISNMSVQTMNSPSKWKAVKVVFFTTGAFVVTWMPYFIAIIVFSFCPPNSCDALSKAIASPLAALGFFNSILNPIIYAWWYEGFRNSFRKVCCKRDFDSKKKSRDSNMACATIS